MAPKRSSLSLNPPSPSSSEDGSDSESLDEKEDYEEQSLKSKKPSVRDEEDEESERVSQKLSLNQAPSKTPPLSDSESSEGSDSEPEPDSKKTSHSTKASDIDVKPVPSKSKKNPSNSKKPILKVSFTPSKPAPKRLPESEKSGKDSNKKRKVDNRDASTEEKSGGIVRVFSEDDEIVLLKGMLEYLSKKEADPFSDLSSFHEFIRKSLHVDVSKSQLSEKVRRMRKKYHNFAGKGENGEDPVFSKPHDHKFFTLGKKLWGVDASNGGNFKNVTRMSARKNAKVSSNLLSSLKKAGTEKDSQVKPESSMEDFWSLYPNLRDSLDFGASCLSLYESGKKIMMENMKLIKHDDAKRLNEKWLHLKAKEIKLLSKRLELIGKGANAVLNGHSFSGLEKF